MKKIIVALAIFLFFAQAFAIENYTGTVPPADNPQQTNAQLIALIVQLQASLSQTNAKIDILQSEALMKQDLNELQGQLLMQENRVLSKAIAIQLVMLGAFFVALSCGFLLLKSRKLI
jgi:hypothetical protein